MNMKVFLCLLLLFFVETAFPARTIYRAANSNRRQDRKGCFIVKVKDDARHRRSELFHRFDGHAGAMYNKTNCFVKCSLRQEDAEQLADDDDVEYVEEDMKVTVDAQQTTGSTYWNLDRVDQALLPYDNLFTWQYTGQGVPIYVLDTGVNGAHEEFTGRMGKGIDLITPGGDPNLDCHGHGTHVAGIAAGNRSGVAKLATVISVRVIGCDNLGRTSLVVAGINWVMTQPRGVIVMSLGSDFSQSVNDAVAAAVAKNYVAVVAAGNTNSDACTKSPSSAPAAITVAATNSMDRRSSYSNYGSCVDIFAPGDNIISASGSNNTEYVSRWGTSMAAPLVAGAAAAFLSSNPSLSAEQIATILGNKATSGVVGDPMGSPNLLLKTSGPFDVNSRSPSASPTTASPSSSPQVPSPSPTAPSNDLCANAIELPCGTTVRGSTRYATFNPTTPVCGFPHTSAEVWYSITVPAGRVTLSTCNNATFDTKLTVWRGDCDTRGASPLICMAAADDTGGCRATSVLSQTLPAGQYLVMVHGFRAQTGDFALTLTCPSGPIPRLLPAAVPVGAPSSIPQPSTASSPANRPSRPMSSSFAANPLISQPTSATRPASPMRPFSPSTSPSARSASHSASPMRPVSPSTSPSARSASRSASPIRPSVSSSTSPVDSLSASPSARSASRSASPTRLTSPSASPSARSASRSSSPVASASASSSASPAVSASASRSASPVFSQSASPSARSASRSASPTRAVSSSASFSASPRRFVSLSANPIVAVTVSSPSPSRLPMSSQRDSKLLAPILDLLDGVLTPLMPPSPKRQHVTFAKASRIHTSAGSMYTHGLEDWGYHIGNQEQITSQSAADLSALADTIDKTKSMTYNDGFHAHVLTQQNANFVLSTADNTAITVAVSDWGSGVTKAVVTSFSMNSQTLSQLHLTQDDANPILFACQVNRMNEGGRLLDNEPLALQVKVSPNVPFTVTLYTAEHPEGMDLRAAGGHSTYDAVCDCYTAHVPHSSLIVIRNPLKPMQGATSDLIKDHLPHVLLCLLATISVIGGAVGYALYRMNRRVKPVAELLEVSCSVPLGHEQGPQVTLCPPSSAALVANPENIYASDMPCTGH